jgi:ferritin
MSDNKNWDESQDDLDERNPQIMQSHNTTIEKPPTKNDWERFRTIFTQSYSKENNALNEVQKIMEAKYSFRETSVFAMLQILIVLTILFV